ncbi:DEAD/DEAH box helicase [uncultured Lamprocystis sp.]|uniref:DEAD/DEAH box helicase n=1 Tax=uncultured Lamprocystis sp. TaxID=543132 RepID=UPI0025E9A19E|nr:DEAD/DEAH box helicase [uncultured Lamprocystis sp.]
MIAEALPTLAGADDPAAAPDYLPRQDRNALAATLVDELWKQAGTSEIVPDATGILRVAVDLRRHASNDKALVVRWCEIADEAKRTFWVHPDCLQGDRAARLRGLAEHLAPSPVAGKPRLAQATAVEWFAAVAAPGTAQAKAVILLASDYASSLKTGEWRSVRQTLKIVPDRDGKLRCPVDIWLARADQSARDRHFVADALIGDQAIRQILCKTLEIASLLEDNWLPILEQAIKERIEEERKFRYTGWDWTGFWQILRSARPEDQAAFAAKYKGRVRILRQDGTWQYPYAVLLPGEIVSPTETDPENRKALVGTELHRDDEKLLRLLGVFSKPEGMQHVYREVSYHPHDWAMDEGFNSWTNSASLAFRRRHWRVEDQSFLPHWISVPMGSYHLPRINGLARVRLTELLLPNVTEENRVLTLSHHRKPKDYTPVDVEHPFRWLLRTYGWVQIGNKMLPLATILSRCNAPALERIAELTPLLPPIRKLAGTPYAEAADEKALDALWGALTDHLATREAIADDTLADLWLSAAADGWVPPRLPGPGGDLEISEVYVTGSADLARRARARGWTVVELDEETRALWRQKGALDLDAQFSRGWDAAVASFGSLADALPDVAAVLSREGKAQSYTQVVQGLHLRIGEAREPVPCLHWEGVLYLDQAQLEALPHRERLRLVLTEAAAAGWLDRTPADALAHIADVTLEDRRRAVAAGADLTERLLRAVGGNVTALHAALGDAACRALPADGPPTQVAALTLDLLGPAVLQDSNVSEAMKDADLRPPSRWGTDEARAFVAALGFPETFAQSQSRRLDAELWVSGPLPLPPLHPEYQVEVFDALTGLIAMGSGRRRAVVSLPTGGGKTRIAVEAAVELVLKPEGARRTVLWVAQTNELCEQAVQSFRQVWQNLGAQGETLRVIRFWGRHGNPTASAGTAPTVVVASIQTLNSRFDAPALAWLATPGLVVVDECHHAITPSYTSLLRWLDAEAPRPGAPPKDEPAVIGLSATPFRMDDEESLRLAKRFDQRQYPLDQEGLTDRLLAGGFLACPDYQALATDATVSPGLLNDLDNLWDSQDGGRFDGVLERVNQELATNDARNERLIETLQASDARQILFFTNSVPHAQEMAARLCLLGIPAAAVSGDTPATARRWFLDRFKSGELRVLCNHSVLTTGFDAPRTDLVLIARQVKSPVSYMQMVGRGLRGQRNGGTETCTILTVLDNLGRFREHPFHYCRSLYTRR